MPFESANYSLDEPHPLALVTLTGELVVMVVHALDTEPDRVELHGEMSIDDWSVAVEVGAFHLDLAEQEPLDEQSGPVEVVLVLRRPLLAMCESDEELLTTLFGGETGPLNESEAWLLASAMQQVDVPDAPGATASVGFRTQWARP